MENSVSYAAHDADARGAETFIRPSLRHALSPSLYAHAEQRRDQLLGFDQKRTDKAFGIGWIRRNSTVEDCASRLSWTAHGRDYLSRTEPEKRLFVLTLCTYMSAFLLRKTG
jgi:hypothetical protein